MSTKTKKEKSKIEIELSKIARVAREIEGLDYDAKIRVLEYVAFAAREERMNDNINKYAADSVARILRPTTSAPVEMIRNFKTDANGHAPQCENEGADVDAGQNETGNVQ